MTEQPPPPGNYPPPPPGGYYPPPPGMYPRDPGSGWYPPPPPAPRVLPKEAYTPWSRRLLAFLIDWTPIWILIGFPYLLLLIEDGAECVATALDYGGSCRSEPSDLWAVAMLIALIALLLIPVYFLWNFCYRQGKTGQSIGKSVLEFRVISEKSWQPIGFWRSFLRQLAHYVDQLICYIGYLWPLWDDKRQTLADKIMSTVCVPLDQQEPPPRPTPQLY